mmetsp:Transcript_10986/g.22500  ORF Transcript_10986/g.22500 Transcript_10986/m.22500 type:complete len:107 (+) Transcript_10986:732-1052(+)
MQRSFQSLCGYCYSDLWPGALPDGFAKTPLAQGLYANILFAGYLRVLCHSILLNVFDEAYTIGTSSSGPDSSAGSYSRPSTRTRQGPTVETVDDDETAMAMVHLVK